MSGVRAAVLAALCLVATGCASAERVAPRADQPTTAPRAKPTPPRAAVQTGKASWYGDAHHGKKTASGEPYDQAQLTAAHRSLPLGSRVRVTNVANGRSVVVRINDRGPFIGGRILDLSRAAAQELGPLGAGIFTVRIEVLEDAAADSR